MHAKKKLLFVLINTLLLYIPLLAITDRQIDRQTDRQRVKYTCYTWAGGTFFFSCAVVSVFCAGNMFWFYILLMYLEYHIVVVLC